MKPLLVIACGAIAHELVAVLRHNQWQHMDIQCLPAEWHNTPDKITPAVQRKIHENRAHYEHMLVAYGDCGTGGQLDGLLRKEGIERLPGNHCYDFFAGCDTFATLAEKELGTFYLTDYLARHFQRLILDGLGISKHPELRDMYFGHYKSLVYLAQTENPKLVKLARDAADALGLEYEYVYTGLSPFTSALRGIPVVEAGKSSTP